MKDAFVQVKFPVSRDPRSFNVRQLLRRLRSLNSQVKHDSRKSDYAKIAIIIQLASALYSDFGNYFFGLLFALNARNWF